jgi:hypothetical protein
MGGDGGVKKSTQRREPEWAAYMEYRSSEYGRQEMVTKSGTLDLTVKARLDWISR